MRSRGLVAELGARERIERNQVELARHVAHERRELARVRGAVVDAVEHHVLERHEVARRAVEVAQARREELGERILAVDRHEAVAQRVVAARAATPRARPDTRRAGGRSRHEARRRQRDAAARQAVGVVVEHQPQRRHDVVEVGERLAHAHHHDVGDRRAALLDPGRADAVGEQRAVRVPELADDLGGRQVAVEALLAGRAERAVERAARLRRDAQRAAVVLRNVDRLDRVAVADVEQPLARAVGGGRVADRPSGRSIVAVGRELLAQRRATGRSSRRRRRRSAGAPSATPAARETASRRGRRRRPRGSAASRSSRLVTSAAGDRFAQRLKTASAGKKYAISVRAVSGASEPCTALASIDLREIGADRARLRPSSGRWRPSGRGSSRSRCRPRAPGSSPGRRS